jgi:hypothetical protein
MRLLNNLTVNMNKPYANLKPTRIAKGVDPNRYDVPHSTPIPPNEPMRDYQTEQMRYADVQARYNQWGNFAVNARSAQSRRRAIRNMYRDANIHGINDDLRKR